MELRSKIEAVLRKYSKCCDPAYPGHPTPYVVQVEQAFLDDLLACTNQPLCANCGKNPPHYCYGCWETPNGRPQPSREALEKILWDRRGDTLWGTGKRDQPPELLRILMAWATGQQELKGWCEHIRKIPLGWGFNETAVPGSPGALTWIMVEANWSVCPICAVPRPEGA